MCVCVSFVWRFEVAVDLDSGAPGCGGCSVSDAFCDKWREINAAAKLSGFQGACIVCIVFYSVFWQRTIVMTVYKCALMNKQSGQLGLRGVSYS